jgi:hypothetical protein
MNGLTNNLASAMKVAGPIASTGLKVIVPMAQKANSSWFTKSPTSAPTEAAATPSTPAPTEAPTQPVTITDPKEVNLFQQFAKSGDLTDVVNDDELTVFQQIKKKIKDGDFSDIVKSLPSPPPFPTALVMQIVGSLNDIFQQNIGKVSKYAEASIDYELEKKKNELELTKALGEEAKKTNLNTHMPAYINHVMK